MADRLISEAAAIDAVHKSIFDFFDICDDDEESPMTYKDEQLLEINKAITTRIKALPSAQPPLEEFEWCTDCKEYDQKAHCCHRFTKVIRKTVEELQVVRCKDCIHNNDCEIQYAAQTDEWFYCGYGEKGEKDG